MSENDYFEMRRDMKKYFSKLTLAIVVALVMGLAFAAPALADPLDVPLNPADLFLSITKRIDMDAGTDVPDARFDFAFTQVVPVPGVTPGEGASFVPRATITGDRPGLVNIPLQSIHFPDNMVPGGAAPDTVYGELGRGTNAGLDLGEMNWPHAGNFFFVVQEIPDTNTAIAADPRQSMLYDDTVWMLAVTVMNYVDSTGNEVLRIRQILVYELGGATAPVWNPPVGSTPGFWGPGQWVAGEKQDEYRQGQWNPGTPGQPGSWDDDNTPSCILFENQYADNRTPGNDTGNDRPGNEDCQQTARFSITKTVVGPTRANADLTTDFAFTATLNIGAVTVAAHLAADNEFTLPATIRAFVQEQNAAGEWEDIIDDGPPPGARFVVFTRNYVPPIGDTTGITYTPRDGDFMLRDGQRLRFAANVPSGTTAVVTERALDNWAVQSVHFTESGGAERLIGGFPADNYGSAFTADSGTLVPPGVVTSAGNESMDFGNRFFYSPLMGLVIGSMPFMVALFAATVLLAMMVASRSRQRIEQLPIAY